MRKLAGLLAIACLAPAVTGFGPPSLIESDQVKMPVYASVVPIIQKMQAPDISAASYLMTDAAGVILSKAPATSRPMASVTKIMTALLAIERGRLQQVIDVKVDSTQMGDSSVMGLRPGEALSLEDLLYGLLLPSGNDAAEAIAEAIGGSKAGFVDMMNQRASSLGLHNTRFVNPHGLDADGHFSSAEDLVRLAQAAMANSEFAKLVSTKERVVVGKLATYRLKNTNQLLWDYPEVDGIKTGLTDAAGQCLVVTAVDNGTRVFTAVLDSNDRYEDTKKMLNFFRDNYDCRQLPLPSLVFAALHSSTPDVTPGADSLAERRLSVVGELTDCRPAWQASWRRVEVQWDDVADSPLSAVYFVGDREIGRLAVIAN